MRSSHIIAAGMGHRRSQLTTGMIRFTQAAAFAGLTHLAPCDDHGHGTHTTGTTSATTGRATRSASRPGAKWIGCRNMDVGVGTPATYTECFQFFIAPTDLSGNNPNPALRASRHEQLLGLPGQRRLRHSSELETIVNNTQARVSSSRFPRATPAPAALRVTDPPAIYERFLLHRGDYVITNTLASFSSRGPSHLLQLQPAQAECFRSGCKRALVA